MPSYQCKQHIVLHSASSAPTQLLHAVSVTLFNCWVTPTIKTEFQRKLLGASVWSDVISALTVAMDKAAEHVFIMLFISVTV